MAPTVPAEAPDDGGSGVTGSASAHRGRLLAALGHEFGCSELLDLALVHRSWCAENGVDESNERLEFLGDAVIGLAVARRVFADYASMAEGQLAKMRASVVSASALADIARSLDLGSHLALGRGEERSGGRAKQSILADALEAVVGAVFLDGGWDAAVPVVDRLFAPRIAAAATGPGGEDHKTRLQELVVARFSGPPEYAITSEGPEHAKRFTAEVYVEGVSYGEGSGSSKKAAEQAAAGAAWGRLAASRSGETPANRTDLSVKDEDHTHG